jgi:hypothetical protein
MVNRRLFAGITFSVSVAIYSTLALAQNTTNPAISITDPTFLTTQQLLRENTALKELIFSKLDSITTRLDAMDKAVQLLHTDVTHVPTDVDKQVGNLKELVFQKLQIDYDGVQLQFKERDTRVDQTAKDSKVAVDAALSAAKEAVGEQNKSSALAIAKQEATFTKQIDQLSILLSTVTKGQEDKINDIKASIASSLGRSSGIGDSWGVILAAGGLIIGVAGAIIAFRKPPEPYHYTAYRPRETVVKGGTVTTEG